ncbi:MAG: vitamin K epoxide reductase family protein [Leptolyngbyaceae cyanobacterium CSU_1_3]|nr:vitamin K epoxide reductase family protein [Leptolyngbyaceae cyanobacterium CSU_1_3]
MTRRRSIPWIHRWSRPIIGAIATLGAINTGYIAATKLFGGQTACPAGGCDVVLSSPYATVFGLPLALFGFLAYVGVAAFALVPLAVNSEANKSLRTNLENWTWLLLFAGSTAMLLFSGYLMYVMAFELKTICYYCIASAIFAAALFGLTLVGQEWQDVGQLFLVGIVVGMVTLISTLAIYAPKAANAGEYAIASGSGQVFFTVKDTSGEAEIQLAQHLKKTGAKMYSAYWCPHCYEQKKLFGVEALGDLPSVECAADGKNSQTALCQEIAPKVEKETGRGFGFPTWEINGKFYAGQQPLEELAKASGYNGPRNFKNSNF